MSTQAEQLLGVDSTTVGRWERGTQEPQPWMRPKIAKALGLTVEELADLIEPPHVTPIHNQDQSIQLHQSQHDFHHAPKEDPPVEKFTTDYRSVTESADRVEPWELADALTRSAISKATLEHVESAVYEVAARYPTVPPDALLSKVSRQLNRIMANSSRWLRRGTRTVYTSPWLNVDLDDVEVPGGQRFEHHVVRFPRSSVGAVVVENDKVLLLWRHRFATDMWGWEIPAGWSDDGADPAETARREVLEETGYQVPIVDILATHAPLSGISSQIYQVFFATGVKLVGEPEAAEVECVEWIPLSDVPKMMADGQVPDGPSVAALGYYFTTRQLNG